MSSGLLDSDSTYSDSDNQENNPISAIRTVLQARNSRQGMSHDSNSKTGETATGETPNSDARPSDIQVQELTGNDGKKLKVAFHPDGKVVYTSPPPPIRSVTFSGGGGKGAALPGAIIALEKNNVLQELTEVSGASVGSMTAALVACGSSAAEFAEIANDKSVASKIKEGKSMMRVIFGGGLTGEGLESLVRDKTKSCLLQRIEEYMEAQDENQQEIDPGAVAIYEKLKAETAGPTFLQLRTLSRIIPSVKEVKISGTYIAEIDPRSRKKLKGDLQQLVMFTADTEPNLEIAVAVRASAALPPVFSPVDIPLNSGIVARFQDGGVLNNAPSETTLQQERNLDPIPESSGMTFMFEDKASKAALKGEATPKRSRFADMLTGAKHSAAEYSKNRRLADHPDEIVVVPLKIEVGRKKKKKSYGGLRSGTVNFSIPLKNKLKLQAGTEVATSEHIAERLSPKDYGFDSKEQLLMSMPFKDLQAISNQLEGATEALAFRTEVIARVAEILRLVKEIGVKAAVTDDRVLEHFAEMDSEAGGQEDRLDFIARTVNKYLNLDPLLDAIRSSGTVATLAMEQCYRVNDKIIVQAHANTIQRDLIYPMMVRMKTTGPGVDVLTTVDNQLRRAETPKEFNAALQIAIDHFKTKRDRMKIFGYAKFAARLKERLMNFN